MKINKIVLISFLILLFIMYLIRIKIYYQKRDSNEISKESNSNCYKKYGPIIVPKKIIKVVKGKKIICALNQQNKKLIIAINCKKKELNIRIPGRKWMGSKPAKEEFEKNLIYDFCKK